MMMNNNEIKKCVPEVIDMLDDYNAIIVFGDKHNVTMVSYLNRKRSKD